MTQECIFCKIVKKEIPCTKVYEDQHILAFYDLNPQAPKHILIIPKKHIDSLSALGEDDIFLLGKMIYQAKQISNQLSFSEDAYRIVINNGEFAGQVVFHLHIHLLANRKMQWPPG